MLRVADDNGDGKISKQEFLTYLLGDEILDASGRFADRVHESDLMTKLKWMGPAGDLIGQLFDAVDDDQSGFLEEAEGKLFLELSGCETDEIAYYWNE